MSTSSERIGREHEDERMRSTGTCRDLEDRPYPHPRKLEQAALELARAAQLVDDNIMESGLATRRQRLRDAILDVRLLVEQARKARVGR